ncbi:unnamed protein product [Arctia plantaginis]|uniref:Uncharacterized protein n=1 Tax=Arctia plantaginis TaxID=874455 RepID=A0A8S1B0U2_ARCPL|nr:unnamed protein product [Arctia plantaginis]CAB3252000.1 unnamed protein product [Arctia plantaginis]
MCGERFLFSVDVHSRGEACATQYNGEPAYVGKRATIKAYVWTELDTYYSKKCASHDARRASVKKMRLFESFGTCRIDPANTPPHSVHVAAVVSIITHVIMIKNSKRRFDLLAGSPRYN